MPKISLKEIRQKEKVAKYSVTAGRLIAACGGVENIFPSFRHKPTDEELVSVFVAGKYGLKDPLFCGGVEFALEYAFDEYNRCIKGLMDGQIFWISTPISPWRMLVTAQNEPFANILFWILADQKVAPFLITLERQEFTSFTERQEELIHIETRSLVFDLKYAGAINKNDPILTSSLLNNQVRFIPSPLKGELVHHYVIWVGAPDLYLGDDREKHSVREHLRSLKSGKTVAVSAHERRNRLAQYGVPFDTYEDYIVYRVYDCSGNVRYIGEGRPDRPGHVNSGASHNIEINRHFFLKGPMRIEEVCSNLTKAEALAIERLLIKSYSPFGLWNIKDNLNQT